MDGLDMNQGGEDLEARAHERADELTRTFVAQSYKKHAYSLDLPERFAALSSPQLTTDLDNGKVSLAEVVIEARRIYLSVERYRDDLGSAGMLRKIASMDENHPLGLNPRMIGWVAAREILGDDQLSSSVRTTFGIPKDIPRLPVKFWRLGREQGFKREHDPRTLFLELARMELEPHKHDLGRKRKIRQHKEVDRRSWRVSMFYSTALIHTLSKKTGIPARTVYRYLRTVGWEMPPEWTLV